MKKKCVSKISKIFQAMEKFSSQLMFELTTEEKNDYFLQKFDYKDVTTESLMLILQLCYPKSRVIRNPCKTSTIITQPANMLKLSSKDAQTRLLNVVLSWCPF